MGKDIINSRIIELLNNQSQEILCDLIGLTAIPDKAGNIAQKLSGIFKEHLQKEQKFIFPILLYLKVNLNNISEDDQRVLKDIVTHLRQEHAQMYEEYNKMLSITNDLEQYALSSNYHHCLHVIMKLRRYLEIEEEIYYPAALLLGSRFV